MNGILLTIDYKDVLGGIFIAILIIVILFFAWAWLWNMFCLFNPFIATVAYDVSMFPRDLETTLWSAGSTILVFLLSSLFSMIMIMYTGELDVWWEEKRKKIFCNIIENFKNTKE